MSMRSPRSSSLAQRVRRHWLLVAIVGLAFVALWAGQPAMAADARPEINQTVPPATPRPEVPPPSNNDKKDDKKDNEEDQSNNPAPAAEPTVEITPEITPEATPEVTVEAAAEVAAEVSPEVAGETAAAVAATVTADQTPEALPTTGNEASLPLIAAVAGLALLLLAGAALITRRSA